MGMKGTGKCKNPFRGGHLYTPTRGCLDAACAARMFTGRVREIVHSVMSVCPPVCLFPLCLLYQRNFDLDFCVYG